MFDKTHKRFICINGEMLPADEPSLMHTNRSFLYGDAIFETIHGNGSKLQFFGQHYERLAKSMKALKMEMSHKLNADFIESSILRMLKKNHHYKGVRIRLTVFRDPGGYYTPVTGSCSFLAESAALENDRYHLNEKGLKAGIFSAIPKHAGILSGLKSANSLIYVIAGLYKNEQGFDECFILNSSGRLAEAISSNLFIVKQGILYTPQPDEGCVDGVMRRQIIRISRYTGIECNEALLSEDDLMAADECFLTNAIKGIQWVVAFRDKRYFSKTSRLLLNQLNNEQFSEG